MLPRNYQLVTPRLVLRPLLEEDRQAMIAIVCDPKVTKSYMIPDFESQEQKDAFFQKLMTISQNRDRFVYGIALDGMAIGFLNEVEKDDTSIELGYFIDSNHWNKGYASEALHAAIEELFRMGFSSVRAAHFEMNPASGRVMQKCGMTRFDKDETIDYRGQSHRCVYYAISRP